MGFKSDREFLRNVSIGAIGTRRVAEVLNRGGFNIIELERYCTSNKIWATKIKRLRVPDLLCVRTGVRVESRGKSKLEVTMSHAVNNPDRAWDKGLRDNDLIAFVKCTPEGDTWTASERVALFRTADMRATAEEAGLSRMKSTAEGSEIRLTWPACVPGSAGTVTAVSADRIDTLLATSRKQAYRLTRRDRRPLVPYVRAGDTFGNGDTTIASVMPTLVPTTAPDAPQYDFVADLHSERPEDVYAAIKALGFLADQANRGRSRLEDLAETHPDPRIKLEAAATLARNNVEVGWDHLREAAGDESGDLAYRMETALILAELPGDRPTAILKGIAANAANPSELRAAAVWGLGRRTENLQVLRPFIADPDELTAVHAIVATGCLINASNVATVLSEIGADHRKAAGLVRAVISSNCDYMDEAIRQLQSAPMGLRRQWLLYLLAVSGRERVERAMASVVPDAISELEFFWTHQAENWTNRLDVADQIDYLEQQRA